MRFKYYSSGCMSTSCLYSYMHSSEVITNAILTILARGTAEYYAIGIAITILVTVMYTSIEASKIFQDTNIIPSLRNIREANMVFFSEVFINMTTATYHFYCNGGNRKESEQFDQQLSTNIILMNGNENELQFISFEKLLIYMPAVDRHSTWAVLMCTISKFLKKSPLNLRWTLQFFKPANTLRFLLYRTLSITHI